MNDEERARHFVKGLTRSMPMTTAAEERLRGVFADAFGKARGGTLSEDEARKVLAELSDRTSPPRTPSRAVRVYSVQHGDFWRGQCTDCGWHSKNLPFPTREQAEHATSLHKALCKGAPA